MRIETLLSPGMLSNGINLRSEACKAISNAEITAARSGGTGSLATTLHAFFTDCAAKVAALRDLVVPTVTSRTQPTGGNTIVITHSEGLDPTHIPPLTSFVTSPVRTITGVSIIGAQVFVTYSGASLVNANTIAYTQPTAAQADSALSDLAGNKVASYTAQAITVA